MNEVADQAIPTALPLEWIRGLASEEIGQRENESQFEGADSDYPVDWETAENDARQQWAALTSDGV